ncbi:hypothetical protein QM027_00940 [Campylobacter concisus]
MRAKEIWRRKWAKFKHKYRKRNGKTRRDRSEPGANKKHKRVGVTPALATNFYKFFLDGAMAPQIHKE